MEIQKGAAWSRNIAINKYRMRVLTGLTQKVTEKRLHCGIYPERKKEITALCPTGCRCAMTTTKGSQ